jgi:hypothetical protein
MTIQACPSNISLAFAMLFTAIATCSIRLTFIECFWIVQPWERMRVVWHRVSGTDASVVRQARCNDTACRRSLLHHSVVLLSSHERLIARFSSKASTG